MPPRRSLRSRNYLTSQFSKPTAKEATSSRRTRSTSRQPITVARADSRSPDDNKKSIRLTVKMPSSKLRAATSGAGNGNSISAKEKLEPAEIVNGPRASRGKKSYVMESSSEEEEEEEEEEEAGASDVDDDVEEDEDAEGETEEADEEEEDIEMEEPSAPPPKLKVTGPLSHPKIKVLPALRVKSVEAKEIEIAAEEELSDLETGGEEADAGEEDAEGDDVGGDQEIDPDDEGSDSDIEASRSNRSRGSTPDVSKMTKRQKSRLDQVMGGDFLALPMEPQTKKHLTAEEHAMRRAEMARRRKNLSEKRNEEEKMDTINRLLKKQAPKRRGKISAAEISANAAAGENVDPTFTEYEKPRAAYVRWTSDAGGCRVGVPIEWLGGPAGRVFEGRGKIVGET